MNDEVRDKDEAIDKIASAIKIAIKGWPVYGVVVALLWGYGELWLDAKIADAIKTQTLEQPAVVILSETANNNKAAIDRVEGKVEEIEGDTKAILRHLAGADATN